MFKLIQKLLSTNSQQRLHALYQLVLPKIFNIVGTSPHCNGCGAQLADESYFLPTTVTRPGTVTKGTTIIMHPLCKKCWGDKGSVIGETFVVECAEYLAHEVRNMADTVPVIDPSAAN